MAGANLKLPKRVRAAFQDHDWLSLPDLAEAFEMSERTMRKLLVNGTLPWHRFGAGSERIHYRFTRGDAEAFWRQYVQTGRAKVNTYRY
jgi:hypothetical protein